MIHSKAEMNLKGVEGSQTQDAPLCGPLYDGENIQVWLPQGGGRAGGRVLTGKVHEGNVPYLGEGGGHTGPVSECIRLCT